MKNIQFWSDPKWLLCSLLLMGQLQLIGQHEKIAFEKYGVAEGLPEEFVSDVIQDDKGFIWCATQNGLVKYDGYKFQVYKVSGKTDTNSLQLRNLIGGLVKSRDGKIWIGGIFPSGIASFDPVAEKFRNYHINNDDYTARLPDNLGYWLLLEDEEGNIWFNSTSSTSYKERICRLDPKTGVIKTYMVNVFPNMDRSTTEPPIIKRAGSVAESSSTIWVLDEKGNINVWNKQKDSFEIALVAGSLLSPSATADTIRSIMKGRSSHLLLTSEHGLYVFDSKNQKLLKTYNNVAGKANNLTNEPIAYAFEDLNGQFWVFHQHGAISLINAVGDSISRFKYGSGILSFDKGPKKVPTLWVSSQNKEGIWLQSLIQTSRYTYTGFFLHYNFAEKKFRYYDEAFNVGNNPLPIMRPTLYRFFEDRTGLLWLNTRPNLYKQAPKKYQIDLFRYHQGELNSLPSDTILYLFEDSKRRLWVGTRNGLAIYQPGQENFRVFRHNPVNPGSISHNTIYTISEDADGKIWIASGNGLNQWVESTNSFRHFSFTPKQHSDTCFLFIDRQQRLWCSAWNKGIFLLDTKTGRVLRAFLPDSKDSSSISNTHIDRFFQDSRGNIWLGQRGGNTFGLYRLNKNEDGFINYKQIPGDSSSISDYRIFNFIEDEEKRLWICTNRGLNLFDYKNNTFSRYWDVNASSFTGSVRDFQGNIWYSTYSGGGLASVNAESRKITLYGEREGLSHNDIFTRNAEIAVDDFGRLWLPTQRGLSVFNPVSKSFTNYFEKDGFQPSGRYSEIRTSNGDIWIGGEKGLNRIVPASLLKKDSTLPSVVITQMAILDSAFTKPDGRIFTKAVAYTDSVRLRHWQKDVSFEFVALHYLRPEDNLYSWKLVNYDRDWSMPSHRRTATYTNLSPGTYIFRVKAANADGIWNEQGAFITIKILPPWWETWWAYLFYAIILITFIWGVVIYRSRNLKARNIRLEQKVALRTAELKTSLENLRATQAQLIQSEKMASLGELTAGIAHEIQNPLNFVNNFSEINSDLVDEADKEIEKGNSLEARALLNAIKDNEQKIIHHGKRADAIVKGMLQHSRASSGQKESTDINALADEYLRLAYHGFRAREKSFNATMQTDFDGSIGKINLAQQDIGRVLLNLISNAFYAVNEKDKQNIPGYEPTVVVSTKKKSANIEISVKDNGNGIPDAIKEKIFQPFFTTKPTGQGTGLGLSLAYDIVKAHGGEIKVKTIEGEGAEFIIELTNA